MRRDLWLDIRNEYLKGVSISEIARKYNINWRTAQKYATSEMQPTYERKKKSPSKLDPFKSMIELLLEEAPYSAVRIYEIIKNSGYTGKYGLVKEFVGSQKKHLNHKATVRFETLPGKQAQVDWGHFKTFIDSDGVEKKLYCFLMILGYSRTRYIEFVTDMSTSTLLTCHQNAFRYFKGYPEEILYDNMKQVVIKRVLQQEHSTLNPQFEDFAGFYGFKPILCRPYRGQTKGKVERTVRYVRNNFFVGLRFQSLEELNQQAFLWCEKVNHQIHGTTQEIPYERLKQEYLNPIKREYLLHKTVLRKVEKDCLLSFENNKYSVPPEYVFKEVAVNKENHLLKVYHNHQLIATHSIPSSKQNMVILKTHYAGISTSSSDDKKENSIFFDEEPLETAVENRDLAFLDEWYGEV